MYQKYAVYDPGFVFHNCVGAKLTMKNAHLEEEKNEVDNKRQHQCNILQIVVVTCKHAL